MLQCRSAEVEEAVRRLCASCWTGRHRPLSWLWQLQLHAADLELGATAFQWLLVLLGELEAAAEKVGEVGHQDCLLQPAVFQTAVVAAVMAQRELQIASLARPEFAKSLRIGMLFCTGLLRPFHVLDFQMAKLLCCQLCQGLDLDWSILHPSHRLAEGVQSFSIAVRLMAFLAGLPVANALP